MSQEFRPYSRAEYLSDAVVHVLGLVAVAAAVPALIAVAAATRGDAAAMAGVSVYGATLALMLLASALYNMIDSTAWSALLCRLDHSAIYLKIAGTFTAFVAVTGHSFGLLAALWGAAIAGVGMKLVSPARFRWAGLALYLGMGWAGALAGWAIFAALPAPAIVLAIAGGLLYTGGVAFHLWNRLPFHNTIWHVFVLAATGLFYAAVVLAVVG